MAQCINTRLPEYQHLKSRAGISEADLIEQCSYYIETYNRFPRLDELSGCNSEQHIKDALKIKKNESTKIENILDATHTNNLDEAVVKLNKEYLDKEISIIPIDTKDAIVRIQSRPIKRLFSGPKNVNTGNMNLQIVISNTIDKLSKLYGIHFNEVNDAILAQEEWRDLMPRDKLVKAFVYNGEIYINTDKATEDSRIHEMLHLLIGSLRFNNPNLYQQLIESAQKFKNYFQFLEEFKNKTRNDANEEIFVQELAKYLAGMNSDISELDSEIVNEITYNVNRVLDTMLMGDHSTKMFSKEILFNSKLKDVVRLTNSSILTNKGNRNPIFENSETHRKLNNLKADLKRTNQLKEICD